MSAKCRAPLALPLVITGGLTDPTPCSSISLYFVFIFFLSLGGGTPFVRIYRAFLILYVEIPCPRSNDVFTSRHFGVVQWRRNVFWTGEEVTKNVQAGGYGGSRSYFSRFQYFVFTAIPFQRLDVKVYRFLGSRTSVCFMRLVSFRYVSSRSFSWDISLS